MERDPLTGAPVVPPPPRASRRGRRLVAGVGAVVVVVALLAWWWRSKGPDAGASGAQRGLSAVPSAVPNADAGSRLDDGAAGGAAGRADSTRVIVEVLNASGLRGLGRRATAVLRERGFDVVYTANAPDTTRRDSTLVLDRAGRAADAARVAKALGGARVEARPDSSRYVHVTVLLGGAWRPPANALYP